MKRLSPFLHRNRLLLKNLAFIYLHVGGIILWLLGAITAGGVAIAYLDGKPILDSLYLAFITGLTVGYGDITPETGASKMIAVAIGFLGIVFTAIVVAVSVRALEMTVREETAEDS